MDFEIGDIIELKEKYGFSCCAEQYKIIGTRGHSYLVAVICTERHGRCRIGKDEILDDAFTLWVKRVRKEHGLTV